MTDKHVDPDSEADFDDNPAGEINIERSPRSVLRAALLAGVSVLGAVAVTGTDTTIKTTVHTIP